MCKKAVAIPNSLIHLTVLGVLVELLKKLLQLGDLFLGELLNNMAKELSGERVGNVLANEPLDQLEFLLKSELERLERSSVVEAGRDAVTGRGGVVHLQRLPPHFGVVLPLLGVNKFGLGKPDIPRENLTFLQDVSGTKVENVKDQLVKLKHDFVAGPDFRDDGSDLDLQVSNTVGFLPMLCERRDHEVLVGTVAKSEKRLVRLSLAMGGDLDRVFLAERHLEMSLQVKDLGKQSEETVLFGSLAEPDLSHDRHVGSNGVAWLVAPSALSGNSHLNVQVTKGVGSESLLGANDGVDTTLVGVSETRDIGSKHLVAARGGISQFGQPTELRPQHLLLTLEQIDVFHVVKNGQVRHVWSRRRIGVIRIGLRKSSNPSIGDIVERGLGLAH